MALAVAGTTTGRPRRLTTVMKFSFSSWALGWLLKQVGDSAVAALMPSKLQSRLYATIRHWAENLPTEHGAVPDAIFAHHEWQPGPAHQLLTQRLIDSQPPSVEEWHDALLERWRALSSQQDECLQPFFRLPEAKATKCLRHLAERLTAVCLGDAVMFRHATSGLDQRIQSWSKADAVLVVNDIIEPPEYGYGYNVLFPSTDSHLAGVVWLAKT